MLQYVVEIRHHFAPFDKHLQQMNPSFCFKTIRMSYNGKSTTADITDTVGYFDDYTVVYSLLSHPPVPWLPL